MFSGFGFHFFSGVEIYWQLLNLKTIFIRYFVCHTSILSYSIYRLCPLLLMIVTKRYLRMALIRGNLCAINRLRPSHIDSIDILLRLILFCTLPRLNDAVRLDICFLASWGSAWGNALAVGDRAGGLVSSGGIVGVRVEIVTCSRERGESALSCVVGFEGLIDAG